MMNSSWISIVEGGATQVFHASWQAALLTVIVLVVSYLFGRGLDARWRFALWLVVFARMAVPVVPATPWSIFQWMPRETQVVAERPSLRLPELAPPGARPVFDTAPAATVAVELVSAQPAETATRPGNVREVSSAAPAAVAIAPQAQPIAVSAWLGLIWIVGVLLLWLRLGWSMIQLRRERRRWTAIDDPAILELFERCRRALPCRRKVLLYSASDESGPAMCGWLRPTIVIPRSFLTSLSASDLGLLLMHELMHVRRCDLLADRLANIVASVHWFNPLGWVALAGLRRERELACDAALLDRLSPSEAHQYGHLILRAVEALSFGGRVPASVGMWGSNRSSSLQRRIHMIALYRKPGRVRKLVASLLLVLLAAVGLTDARGEPKAPQTPTAKVAAAPDAANRPDKADPAQGTLSGTVVDADGKPVAGARVSINKSEFDGNTLVESFKSVAESTTDAQGHFRLGPIEPAYRALLDLRIEAEGFAPQYVPSQTYSIFPGRDFDLGKIGVYQGRVFSGQVLDADSKPRAGATVECQVRRCIMGHTVVDVSPARKLTTDADGRFRTPPVSVGEVVLSLQEPERQLAWRAIAVRPGGEEALAEPIRLENDIPVAGVVKDEAGRPIEGAAIRANSEHRATSDPQGKFVLRGFGPNPHFQLQIAKEGFVFINWGVQVSEAGFTWHEVQSDDAKPVGPTKDFTVVMKRAAWIEGQAIDADSGQPVRLDKVILCTFERKPNGEIVRAGCKDSRFEQPEPGRFRVAYSRPDEYTLTFIAAGYQDAETFTPLVKMLQPIEGIVVKLKKAAGTLPQMQKQRFVGTVTRDGKPLQSGWVGLWTMRRPNDTMNAYIMRGRTATGDPIAYSSAPIRDGVYSLDVPFQDGGWYVVVEEPGQAITQVGPFRIKANEEQKLDIACVDGGGISGHVENVPEAWKGQLWAVAFSRTAVREETRVDADGKFSFKQLPPGKYGLKVGSDAYQDSEVPRAKDWKDIPKEAWTRIADPWKRATMVTVETGRESDGVKLELPQ